MVSALKNNKLNILVTGGAGFIASNIVDKYIELGHNVIIIDDLSSGKKENINPKAVFYKKSILDKDIEDVFKKHKIDIVNHHAAQIDVRKSVEDPIYDANINVIGLLNILENCKKYNVKKVIFISSGGVVYGEPEVMPPKEDYPFGPSSPYGVTKMVGEYYLRYYAKIFGLKYTVFRYSNVYGPRQNPHGEAGVVAIFGGRCLKNEDCFIFGDGKQTRDYVYVKDVVKANVLALEKGEGEAFNIGTGKTTSVNELFLKIKKITGYKKTAGFKPKRDGELEENYLNVDKAKAILGWKPEHSLEKGLVETVEFIKTTK